jgi:hypothetical protein
VRLRRACAGFVVLVSVVTLGEAHGDAGAPRTVSCLRDANARDVAYALLADNRLVATALAPGATMQELRLSGRAREPAAGHYLALARRNTLFVLVPRGRREAAKLVEVDISNGCLTGSQRLGKTAFRAIAIGPRTQRIYLAGNRDAAGGIGSAVVSVFDPSGRRLLATHTVRRAAGWLVYDTAISPDETRFYVSYHGPSTQGADVLSIRGLKTTRCVPAARSRACLRVHGAVEARGVRLLATAGEPPYILELRANGRVVRTLDSGLAGNHLMEFALDPDRSLLYAVGSCGYTGGLSRLDLESGTIALFGYPAPRDVDIDGSRSGICGERVSVGSALVAVAKTQRPVPTVDRPGQLLFVAAQSGEIASRVPLPSEPVDVLLVGPQ